MVTVQKDKKETYNSIMIKKDPNIQIHRPETEYRFPTHIHPDLFQSDQAKQEWCSFGCQTAGFRLSQTTCISIYVFGLAEWASIL